MKKTLLIFLCLVALKLQAQNYQCIQPGVKQYFSNNKHYLRGMRIDSTVSGAGYVTYFPFHSPRKIAGQALVDTAGGSWLGKSITQMSDGTTLFVTRADTAVIRTQANLGDSWIFYDDTAAVSYSARVVSVDTATVLGSLDSVKIIQLSALKNSLPVSSVINNYQIRLSKNHGFACAFDFFNFPYYFFGGFASANGADYFIQKVGYLDSMGYNFFPIHFSNPNYKDIYDFTPGDVYQSSGSYVPVSISISQVNLTNQDSVKSRTDFTGATSYVIWRKYIQTSYPFGPPGTPSTSFGGGTWNLFVPDAILPVVDTNYMPEESGKRFIYYYNPDDTSRCFRSALYRREHYWFPYPLDAPTNEIEGYKVGFGLVDTTNGFLWGPNNDMHASYHTVLTASLKNGIPCGKIAALSIDELSGHDLMLKAYPLPAEEILHVEWNPGSIDGTISLVDVTGRQVYSYHGRNSRLDIPVANIPSGVYVLRLQSNGLRENRRVLIQH